MKKFIYTILATFVFTNVQAQTNINTIKGVVTDTKTQPLPGISVALEGTKFGTITNEHGAFKIKNVPGGSYILILSGINYITSKQTIHINNLSDSVFKIVINEVSKQLQEVVVQARKRTYNDTISSAAMRTETKLIETPQAVQVIGKEIIKDQQAKSLNDVSKNAVGVSSVSPFSEFIFRGFTSWNSTMYNGVAGAIFPYNIQAPVYNIETIDFVRGPSSVLYSASRPGGVMNLNTKKPLGYNRYEANITYGSWNEISLNADATGPLSKNKKLCYRIIGGISDAGSYRDFQKTKLYTLASSLSYKISNKTYLAFEHNIFYQRQTPGWDNGTVLKMNADSSWNFKNINVHFNPSSPNDYTIDKGQSAELTLQHSFSDKIKFTWLTRYIYNAGSGSNHGSDYADPAVINDTISRWYGKYKYPWHNYQSSVFALFKFKTFNAAHQLLTGVDINLQRQPTYYYTATAANPLNINNPDYSKDDPNTYQYTFDIPDYKYIYNSFGVYIQDQVEINRHLKVSAGIRYDHYYFYWKYSYHDYATDSTYHSDGDTIKAHAFVPRFGIVYNPWKNIAFYYSFSKSFEPQWLNAVNRGGPFPPTIGAQHEIGYKGDFFSSKLSTSLALYSIDYKNVLVADPSDSTGYRYISVNGMRSRGIEMNVQGSINQNIEIIINYSFGEVKYFTDEDGSWKRTDRQLNVPNTVYGAFLNYKFTKSKLKGLGLNLGFHHEGDRVASWVNQDFVTPSYTFADAGMSYKLKKISFYVNVNNITDARYITGGYVTGMVYPGKPRNFRISLNYIF